jgi:predicted anti-sigma-YlaC factor YlaD
MGIKTTCREIHQLVSVGLDRDLSRWERLQLRLHLTICEACTTFNAQMQFLRGAMRRFEVPAEPPTPPVDPE